MNHISCIHSLLDGHLGCFQLLLIINKTICRIANHRINSINTVEHMSLLKVGIACGYMICSDIAIVSDGTISNFLRNRQIDFKSSCSHLKYQQQLWSGPLSPHSCLHLLSPTPLPLEGLVIQWQSIERGYSGHGKGVKRVVEAENSREKGRVKK